MCNNPLQVFKWILAAGIQKRLSHLSKNLANIQDWLLRRNLFVSKASLKVYRECIVSFFWNGIQAADFESSFVEWGRDGGGGGEGVI